MYVLKFNHNYRSNIGQNILFQWIEVVREELQSNNNEEFTDESLLESTIDNSIEIKETSAIDSAFENKCPTIIHGEAILDRKSSFQGHVASLISVEQVQ